VVMAKLSHSRPATLIAALARPARVMCLILLVHAWS
jgi:hypothetical protein